MEYDELSPLAINIVGFRLQMEALFEAQSDTVGEQWSERQPVSIGWPSGDIQPDWEVAEPMALGNL